MLKAYKKMVGKKFQTVKTNTLIQIAQFKVVNNEPKFIFYVNKQKYTLGLNGCSNNLKGFDNLLGSFIKELDVPQQEEPIAS